MPIVIPSRDWGDLESPWISTDLSTWETPLRHGRLREYQPREQVFRQGEDFSSVYIVESGRVRVSVCHADGQEKTLYVADTGAMIGESDCILGQPYSSTATVVLPSRVRAVPSALVQELFHADPVFADWLLQYQARKYRLLLGQNMTLSFDRARQRVAKTLLYLCGQYGRQKEDGIWLTNRFTCSDVAGITNVSRVSVNLIFPGVGGSGNPHPGARTLLYPGPGGAAASGGAGLRVSLPRSGRPVSCKEPPAGFPRNGRARRWFFLPLLQERPGRSGKNSAESGF